MRAALLVVLIAATAAACHDDAAAPAAPPATCIAAAAALRGDIADPGLGDAIANLCREQEWPRGMRDCAAYGKEPMQCLDRLSAAHRAALDDLVRNWQPPRPPFLGVRYQPGPGGVDAGAQVIDVIPGSPAALAGLQAGDWITSYDGTHLTGGDQLGRSVKQSAIGDRPTLVVQRGGSQLVIHPTLVETPQYQR